MRFAYNVEATRGRSQVVHVDDTAVRRVTSRALNLNVGAWPQTLFDLLCLLQCHADNGPIVEEYATDFALGGEQRQSDCPRSGHRHLRDRPALAGRMVRWTTIDDFDSVRAFEGNRRDDIGPARLQSADTDRSARFKQGAHVIGHVRREMHELEAAVTEVEQ